MKIEGNGEVQPQVESDGVVEATEEVTGTTTTEEPKEEEIVLPSDEPSEELIGGKFKSQDDLLNAYKELEKKLGQPKEDVQEPVQEEASTDPEYEAYKQEKKLKETLDPIGGLDKYNKALEWAKDNLPPEDITAYNNSIKNTTDIATARLLAKGLISQAEAASTTTTEPSIYHSNETTKPPKTSGYETKSDMMKDMRDPRYEKDEGFRQKVAAKLAKTDESSWY